MNLCIFVVILTLSSLLPVMAAEIKAKDADTGSVKCSNNGGECVSRNDTQKCLVPLEETDNDCPKGEQCCKRQVTDISVKKSSGCKQDKNCTSTGGFCTKSKKCKKVKNHALCTGKKCTCCLGMTSGIRQGEPGINSMINSLTKSHIVPKYVALKNSPGCGANSLSDSEECGKAASMLGYSGSVKVGSWPNDAYGCLVGYPSDNWVNTWFNTQHGQLGNVNIKSICLGNRETRAWIPTSLYEFQYYSVVIPIQLLVNLDLCPAGSLSIPYDIPEDQKYYSSVLGITCTDNTWILDQHNQGKQCRFVLEVHMDYTWSDVPEWQFMEKPYYEAMRNCLTYSCAGLVCNLAYDMCWMKYESPEQSGEEAVNSDPRSYWRPVCE